MATEVEVTELVAAMVRALQPDYVVETGSWTGDTTEAIGHALARNGHGELVSLEIDEEKAALAQARCGGLPVTVLNRSSMAWTPERPVDFAWFDSAPELRPQEFLRYSIAMHDRTVVGFHDTGEHHPVRGLLAPLERDGILAALYLPTPRGACFARVLR
jgi:predicted O-methyltransferase YrrM